MGRGGRLGRWLVCAAVLFLARAGVAHAQEALPGVRTHSLRQVDTTLLEVDREQRLRDLSLLTPEEGLWHFEEIERQRHRRRFIGHYRKVALHRLRTWSLDLLAGGWSGGQPFADNSDSPSRNRTRVGRAVDWLVNGTDVEFSYGGGDGLTFSLGRDVDWRWFGSRLKSRVEVDPMVGEVAMDFDLRRTSVGCALTRGGEATVSWTIPF